MRRLRRVSAIICVCLFLFLTLSGTALAASLGTHPHIDASDQTTITTGCTIINVHGNGFTPTTVTTPSYADFFVIASTDHHAIGHVTLPVNSQGQVAGPLEVCGIIVTPELIEIVAQDGQSGFYSNTHFTTAK